MYHAPPLPHPVQAMLDIVVISTSFNRVQHAEPGSMTGHLHLLDSGLRTIDQITTSKGFTLAYRTVRILCQFNTIIEL